ncbi:MAG: hypothetical protein A2X59_00715 [Nitrospirae bacterium GWC2_42_7]|nr:MAG: hypothetical protein A2X59_00715 [Nitrospirae bacterium GWC2_42_7]
MDTSIETDLQTLYLFVFLGCLYNIYVSYLLYTGGAKKDIHHFISFFLFTDILLLVTLVYFSNLYENGLLTFYFFLIIMVAMRASFSLSLVLGPFMVLAYLFTDYIVSGTTFVNSRRMALDIAGLIFLSAACGWFAEGKSKAWQALHNLSHKLKVVSSDLDRKQKELDLCKKLEELQKDFVAVMSHELKTPLTGIIGYTDIILAGEAGSLNKKQTEFLNKMLLKSHDLLALIDNLLDLSKIQSGRCSLNIERIDPPAISMNIIDQLKPAAKMKKIKIVHSSQKTKKLPEILADREKIERVLLNIIGNSLKFTQEGGSIMISEDIETDSSLDKHFPHIIFSNQVVIFTIADNGPGIPDEDISHIFERFYRGKDPDNRYYPYGAGIGLSTVKEIVELHWGKVWHEKTPGGGSTFKFTLPVNPIRLRNKIALVRSEFQLNTLVDGLLIEFSEDIKKKDIKVIKEGLLDNSGKISLIICADKQLLQCVLFNILHNQIRYAYPKSDLFIYTDIDKDKGDVIINTRNQGKIMNSTTFEHIECGGRDNGSPAIMDLRQANVNISLARDIIESHGGTFFLENLSEDGVSINIRLPMQEMNMEKEN